MEELTELAEKSKGTYNEMVEGALKRWEEMRVQMSLRPSQPQSRGSMNRKSL